MKPKLILGFLAILVLFETCSSGKSAYKHGDYFDAVMEAVKRLRSSPDNKKSKEILNMSYVPAVDYLNTDAKNQISSGANLKWKAVVHDYEQINVLYENIRTSPGALKVIPDPVNKYKELAVAKDSAAAECYNRAVEAMLKNTREDAKTAFFLFTDANNFSPAYRESIEMIAQAKSNATLKVVIQPTYQNQTNWNFDAVVYGAKVNQFVQFYTPQEIQAQNIPRVDHYLQVAVSGYRENNPTTSRNERNYADSLAIGQKVVAGKTVPYKVYVQSSMVVFQKTLTATGIIQLIVKDGTSNIELLNTNLTSQPSWSCSWGRCSEDSRAIPKGDRDLCGKSETYPAQGQLATQTRNDLNNQLVGALNNYYKSF